MPMKLIVDDVPGKSYWRCTDCGIEWPEFPKHENHPAPHHTCKQAEQIKFFNKLEADQWGIAIYIYSPSSAAPN